MHSISAVHDRLAAQAAAPLSDPNFNLPAQSFFTPTGFQQTLAIQFENNGPEAYTNVTIEVTGQTAAQITNNPEVIGTIGAANSGFTSQMQIEVVGPIADGNEDVTVTLTGERGGNVYQHQITMNIAWFTVNVQGQG